EERMDSVSCCWLALTASFPRLRAAARLGQSRLPRPEPGGAPAPTVLPIPVPFVRADGCGGNLSRDWHLRPGQPIAPGTPGLGAGARCSSTPPCSGILPAPRPIPRPGDSAAATGGAALQAREPAARPG